MKTIIIVIITITLFTNCSKNEVKINLIGKWGSTNNIYDHKEFQFYNDSVVIYEEGEKYLAQWEVDNSKIYINRIVNKLDHHEKLLIEYKFSEKKDTLFFKRSTDSTFLMYPYLIRIKNEFEYFQKLINLNIDLPKTESKLIQIEYPKFDIFVGYNNNQLIAKSKYSENLKNLKYDVYKAYSSMEEGENKKLNFNLIMDKNVPMKSIDSIKKLLTQISVKNIYRTYQNNTTNYSNMNLREEFNWYGIKE